MEADGANQTQRYRDSRYFLKGIATKLVLAVLGAVIIPFFGLIYFIDSEIDTRLKENIVKQSLLNLAGDLAHGATEHHKTGPHIAQHPLDASRVRGHLRHS